MDSLLKRTTIFLGLMVAGLVFYVVWFNIKAESYDETAIPFLNDAIPRLSSWQLNEIEPLLSVQALELLSSEQGKAAYEGFAQLGQFKSMGKPQYKSENPAQTEELGKFRIATYNVPVEFDSGPAVIKINLAATDDNIYIHQFGIHSEVFAEQ